MTIIWGNRNRIVGEGGRSSQYNRGEIFFFSPFFFQESKMVGSSKKKKNELEKNREWQTSSEILEIYWFLKELETKKWVKKTTFLMSVGFCWKKEQIPIFGGSKSVLFSHLFCVVFFSFFFEKSFFLMEVGKKIIIITCSWDLSLLNNLNLFLFSELTKKKEKNCSQITISSFLVQRRILPSSLPEISLK